MKNQAVPHRDDIEAVNEFWTEGLGNYYQPVVFDGEKYESIEQLLIDRIHKKLRENLDSGKPVVFLDFGAGYGISIVRIAKQFKEQIEEGKLLLFASNLFYHPHPNLDRHNKNGYEGGTHYQVVHGEFGEDYYEHAENVYWIRGSIVDIERILLEKGLKLDIFHETYALRHLERMHAREDLNLPNVRETYDKIFNFLNNRAEVFTDIRNLSIMWNLLSIGTEIKHSAYRDHLMRYHMVNNRG